MSTGLKWTLREIILVLIQVLYQERTYGYVSAQAIVDADVVDRNLGGIKAELRRIMRALDGEWLESDGRSQDNIPEKVSRRRLAADGIGGFDLSHNGQPELPLFEIDIIEKGASYTRGSASSSSNTKDQLFHFGKLIKKEYRHVTKPQTDSEKLAFMCSTPDLLNNLPDFGTMDGATRKICIVSFGEHDKGTYSSQQTPMIRDIFEICWRRFNHRKG